LLVTDLREHGLVPLSDMSGELAHAARGIPLHAKDGTVAAFAMVDALDHAEVAHHRWHLSNGYVRRLVTISRKRQYPVLLHRGLLGLRRNDGQEVDHRNGDKLDCRRRNLRLAPDKLNTQNRAPNRNARSRFRGVAWRRDVGQWTAQVTIRGRRHYLGRFDSEEAAAEASAAFRAEHMPFSRN
jgi:hypothetical protein